MIRPNIRKKFPVTEPRAQWKDVPAEKWNSWIWQLQNSLNMPDKVAKAFDLSDEHRVIMERAEDKFRVSITPYYASLIKDVRGPLGLQAIPQAEELQISADEYVDPLAEEAYSPVRGLIHKYPDRVLFYTTPNCALYCRHCTRKRKVSDPDSTQTPKDFENAYSYIQTHSEIRDVVLSGGDPLNLSDGRLENVIQRLRDIDHVEIIRIGSRNIVTMPQRITTELAQMLGQYGPIYVNTQFNHPDECTVETLEAAEKLLNAGCVLGNQMVLLKGVNDDAVLVKEMNHKLLQMGIRPYYIYQCDKTLGNTHFRTPLHIGLEIIEKLDVWTSGLAVPQFIKDIEGGGGKIPLHPNYILRQEGNTYFLRNYRGQVFRYEDIE